MTEATWIVIRSHKRPLEALVCLKCARSSLSSSPCAFNLLSLKPTELARLLLLTLATEFEIFVQVEESQLHEYKFVFGEAGVIPK